MFLIVHLSYEGKSKVVILRMRRLRAAPFLKPYMYNTLWKSELILTRHII